MAFSRMNAQVSQAKGIKATREAARTWTQATGQRDRLAKWSRSRAWSNGGALKRLVQDDITRHRTAFARSTVKAAETVQ